MRYWSFVWSAVPVVPAIWMQAHFDLPWWTVAIVAFANIIGFVEGLARRG